MLPPVALHHEIIKAGMENHSRRDIRDMTHEARIQTQLLTQQGNFL